MAGLENKIRIIVDAEVKKAQADLEKVKDKGEKAGKGIQKGFKSAKLAIAGFAAIIGGSAVAAFASFIRKAGEFEQVRVAFKTFLGDAKVADKVLAKLEKFSIVTPFTIDQVNQAGKALLAFGIAADELEPKLSQIGDLSAGTGKDFNELAVIFGKARVQGTLFAEDINQLTEAGIPIIDEFAKILKVPTSEVKKLGSQGKITFDLLETAFTNLTSGSGKFAGLIEAQADTFLGKLSTLKGNLSLVAREIGEVLIPITEKAVDKLNELLSPDDPEANIQRIASRILELEAQLDSVGGRRKRSIEARIRGLKRERDALIFENDPLAQLEELDAKRLELVKKQNEERQKTRKDSRRLANINRQLFQIDQKREALRATIDDEKIKLEKDAKEGLISKTKELTAEEKKRVDAFISGADSVLEKMMAERDALLEIEGLTEEQRIGIKKRASQQATTIRLQEAQAGMQIAADFISQTQGLFDMAHQNKLALIQNEIAALEDQRDRGVITEEEFAQKREKLNQKEREEKKKAFKANKAAAITGAIIQGALAIVSAWSSAMVLPAPASIVLGALMTAAIAGVTAAQVGVISQQPIPAFQRGTNRAGGGSALVGEAGPELVNIPSGSEIVPSDRLAGSGFSNNNPNSIINTTENVDNKQITISVMSNDPLEFANRLKREYGVDIMGA